MIVFIIFDCTINCILPRLLNLIYLRILSPLLLLYYLVLIDFSYGVINVPLIYNQLTLINSIKFIVARIVLSFGRENFPFYKGYFRSFNLE